MRRLFLIGVLLMFLVSCTVVEVQDNSLSWEDCEMYGGQPTVKMIKMPGESNCRNGQQDLGIIYDLDKNPSCCKEPE